jgi:hypothetical protein
VLQTHSIPQLVVVVVVVVGNQCLDQKVESIVAKLKIEFEVEIAEPIVEMHALEFSSINPFSTRRIRR